MNHKLLNEIRVWIIVIAWEIGITIPFIIIYTIFGQISK
jgi:hypothetical protein